MRQELSRREAIRLFSAAAAGTLFPLADTPVTAKVATREIPSSGERIPLVGLGTSRTFDVGPTELSPLSDVLSRFVALGGRVVDTSPMYGSAESVVGDIAQKLGLTSSLFLATKVWTTGESAGIAQMEESLRRLRVSRLDLMQVHNLVDVGTQLATLRDWKERGRIRYLGVTHYRESSFPDVRRILLSEKLDFLQINYSVFEPDAAERILPLAAERGVAVIANRPFGGGQAFRRVAGQAVPSWAADFDCASWAQFFLKWILANPAVTCAIPATDKVRHLEDNMQGGIGRLPDAALRRRMDEVVAAL